MIAYVRDIKANSTDSHQTSPGYALTFIRWSNRDTLNYKSISNFDVRKPLVVINDAIQVSVSNSKMGITPSMSAVLLGGDINYATAIHPGDFVFVNMVDYDEKVAKIDTNTGKDTNNNSIRNRALGIKPINNYSDGFKGMFKIQTVRKKLMVDPQSGIKRLVYSIQAFGFTEFNNVIYYDPQVFNQATGNLALFQAQFDKFWSKLVKDKKTQSIQELMQMLINTLVGQGTKNLNTKLPAPPNRHFKVPTTVGKLMGVKATYASEIYNYIFGVWGDSKVGKASKVDPKDGFNPSISKDSEKPAGFFKTPTDIQGHRKLEAEYWNNVKVWEILKKYQNPVINEMYSTYRVNVNGRVMPTLVVRQKPFSSLHFNGSAKTTNFMNIPRWRISSNLIYDIDLGKDDAARINFVQIKTRSLSTNQSSDLAKQTATKNFQADGGDIERNGLRPFLATANFDYPQTSKKTKGKEWAELVGDWLINGHLREAGTITCVGIEEPISVGDNLEFDGVVYHIDNIRHTMTIDNTGRKQFRTHLQVSFGTDLRSTKTQPVYPEMEHTDSLTYRSEDFNEGERILPGFSDTQNIGGRVDGEETKETKQESFTPSPKKKNTNSTQQERTGEQKDQDSSINKKESTKIIDPN